MALYFSAAVIARIQRFADDIPLPPEYTVLFEKVASEFLYMKAGVAQVLSEYHLPCLQCIDNDYPPALPFDLLMFQQVVNSLWYNVIGTKTSPPTTMPLKLQNLNTMKIVDDISKFPGQIEYIFTRHQDWIKPLVGFYQNKITESDITISNEKNHG
ncbi:hypothetical protein PHYBLDRAFT_161918 [Phycomyces blakesleeanus NRRL 1555(-)]|uniref:Uncharacterized protein n=1 Tax=Phycomyces blakesleeanus (strain ATCC 8743b / DSM 1359 / FGSC 10004 / NBRC 33097 / NRRL 1555) TaxID=763407 RepID=A0A162YKF1_PHYB8|nr:hypothetical protein PHYBLDRAFT_161918 [Phycomyces blakesleeanus NRRL 1555(-)]OAD81305.1 hypothetical protein PHYBLDRAFT_161918 [Phycomyces blakesleeanus NRRL 1555(-)]|eukprot:XP_018299345.1 hypothetical protein PHYBLDRAFT_161918 [Phycomyces blakesleeanus NRRL 1555(-)]